MNVITWDGFSPAPLHCQHHAVAIGNFDGVHRGHAALLRRLIQLKSRLKCLAQVITFDPSPASVLRPHINIEPLTTLDERLALISQFDGIDSTLVLKSSPELLEQSASAFWNELLCRQLQIQGIVEGRNFCFGKDRQGTIELLRSWAAEKNIPLEVVDDVYRQRMRISSSEIRSALKQGKVELARLGLGRCYALTGTVVHGAHRGRTIGFPTCNLAQIQTLIPKDGVYAARAHTAKNWYAAAVHIGANTTFNETARTVEAHLLDFKGDLYGQLVMLEFIARLRGTEQFDSVEALKQQLNSDVELARILVKQFEQRHRHARQ